MRGRNYEYFIINSNKQHHLRWITYDTTHRCWPQVAWIVRVSYTINGRAILFRVGRRAIRWISIDDECQLRKASRHFPSKCGESMWRGCLQSRVLRNITTRKGYIRCREHTNRLYGLHSQRHPQTEATISYSNARFTDPVIYWCPNLYDALMNHLGVLCPVRRTSSSKIRERSAINYTERYGRARNTHSNWITL